MWLPVDLHCCLVLALVLALATGGTPPDIRAFHFNDLRPGKRAVVLCTAVDGDLPLTFGWLKDGSELGNRPGAMVRSVDAYSATLTIEAVGPESNGNYTCRVTNKFGTDLHTAELAVKVAPQWMEKPTDLSVQQGVTAVLTCAASGFPRPSVTWRRHQERDEKPLANSTRWTIADNGSLIFEKVSKPDEGVYSCEATNGAGQTLRGTARLAVKAPPRISAVEMSRLVKIGDSATMECVVDGDRPLLSSWHLNGTGVDRTERFQFSEEPLPSGTVLRLSVYATQREDAGLYACSASNDYGEANATIVLKVVGPPGRMKVVRVMQVWSRAAAVTWTAPFDGSAPIVQFVVHYWVDRDGMSRRLQEKSVPARQTSTLLDQLQPGTSYGLRVLVENAVGRGELSDVVKFQTEEEAPSAPPTDVKIIATGPTSITIAWKPPLWEHCNGRVLGYYVGHRKEEVSDPFALYTVTGGALDYRITRLQPSTRYSVVVRAFTQVGSGPPSHEVLVETSSAEAVQAPRLFVVDTTDSSILMEWTHTTEIDPMHYSVHYRRGRAGTWHTVNVPGTERSYRLTELDTGARYQLYLTAFGSSGLSDPSDTLTVFARGTGRQVAPSVATSASPPYYYRLQFVVPLAASVVVVVMVMAGAWVWMKRVQYREERDTVRVDSYLYGDGSCYYTLANKQGLYSMPRPVQKATEEEAIYDVPWDIAAARAKQKSLV